jgi:cyanophycinase
MNWGGTLALVGSGEYLPQMDSVDRWLLSRITGEARVVCLPTAAGSEGAERIAYWSRLGIEHFTRLGARVEAVEVIDRASAHDEALAARIRAASFVYLSGGRPEYLLKALSGTLAWAAILAVLAGGGVVAGCSAGAMIFGASIPTFPTLWPWRPALNLLGDAVVFPHFDELSPALARIVKLAVPRRFALVGIEGNTALVCFHQRCEVVGSGGVWVWDRRRRRRFMQGETGPWPLEAK